MCSAHSCLKNQAEAPAQPLKQGDGLLLGTPKLSPALSHLSFTVTFATALYRRAEWEPGWKMWNCDLFLTKVPGKILMSFLHHLFCEMSRNRPSIFPVLEYMYYRIRK